MRAASEVSDFSVNIGGSKSAEDGKMMTKESEEVIEAGIKTYARYFLDFYGGWCFIFTSQLAMWLFLASQFAENYVIGMWANDE